MVCKQKKFFFFVKNSLKNRVWWVFNRVPTYNYCTYEPGPHNTGNPSVGPFAGYKNTRPKFKKINDYDYLLCRAMALRRVRRVQVMWRARPRRSAERRSQLQLQPAVASQQQTGRRGTQGLLAFTMHALCPVSIQRTLRSSKLSLGFCTNSTFTSKHVEHVVPLCPIVCKWQWRISFCNMLSCDCFGSGCANEM